MRQLQFAGIAALVAVGLSAGTAAAQFPGGRVGNLPAGPTVSPYLNLLRGGTGPAINYYGLVRPQFQTNANLRALQKEIGQPSGPTVADGGPQDDIFVTGHAATFMNYGGYFQSTGGAMTAGRWTPTTRLTGPARTDALIPRFPRIGVR